MFSELTHTGMHIHFMHLMQTQINMIFTIHDREERTNFFLNIEHVLEEYQNPYRTKCYSFQ
jgi:hypothetical protein